MKKKLISLLVLLAAAVSGAWADEVQYPIVYDFEAAANAGEDPANKNGSAANGQKIYGWENAEKPDKDRQDYKGYEWAEGSKLPEVCHVWRRSDRINGNVSGNGGLKCPSNKEMAVDGLTEGLTVTIVYDATNATDKEIVWAIGDGSSESLGEPRAKAIINGAEAVPGTTTIKSGDVITVTKVTPAANGSGYIVFAVKKDMVIKKIIIDVASEEPRPDYNLTAATSEQGTGTVDFFINDNKVTGANENDLVTMTITPDAGWVVDVNNVTATPYTSWKAPRAVTSTIPVLNTVELTYVSTDENGVATFTFTMPAASVRVKAEYLKLSALAFDPVDKTNMMTVKVGDEVKNRDPQDATKNVNIRRIQNVLEGTAVKLTAPTGYKFRKVEVKKGVDYTVDLSTLTSNFEAMDGDILFGTTDKTVTIPNGAHVTLQGVNITSAAAIVCNGNATITLAEGSENIVTSTQEYNSGIRAGGNNTTLTINGTGKLTVQGAKRGAGIGSNRRGVCGNIVIESGEIITTTGDYGAGIGSGYHATCGNITIKGGTITATGGSCGAGIGSSFDNAICGDILISGGTITANGGIKAAGIGTGSAQQGWPSTCGNITITDGVTSVTATKGSSVALHSIGKGQNVEDKAYCGTVTIGGVEGYISESPYTYDPHQQ